MTAYGETKGGQDRESAAESQLPQIIIATVKFFNVVILLLVLGSIVKRLLEQ